MDKQLSESMLRRLCGWQRDEINSYYVYAALARREKDEKNSAILAQMSKDEKEHADTWRGYTKKDIAPSRALVLWYRFIGVVMGYTFVLKLLQNKEELAGSDYDTVVSELPEAAAIMQTEHAHERMLIDMLDEERLQYVGSMVLGLNDALVELTGTIAGLTFAMANTRLVALSGIITGISATLSMAASNYLAERADGNENALKSSVYTGVAYLITVVILVLPYLLLPAHSYLAALLIMLASVILIILFFNYYISVAKSQPFAKRFAEMAAISLSVAAISFIIGLLVKRFLGIDI